MKIESQPLLEEFWELRRKYGEYGTYITTHADTISESQLAIFTQMIAGFASEMNEIEFKLKKMKV